MVCLCYYIMWKMLHNSLGLEAKDILNLFSAVKPKTQRRLLSCYAQMVVMFLQSGYYI